MQELEMNKETTDRGQRRNVQDGKGDTDEMAGEDGVHGGGEEWREVTRSRAWSFTRQLACLISNPSSLFVDHIN
jgi:hypothetical protein